MAQKCYIGLNDLAKEIKNIYVGVNGVARKVVKGYIGVNGVARLFWEAGAKYINFWFFIETVAQGRYQNADYFIHTSAENRYYVKLNIGVAFFCLIKGQAGANTFYTPILISTNESAIPYVYGYSSSAASTTKGTITINGDTWYWTGYTYAVYNTASYTPDCLLEDSTYVLNGDQAARDLLVHIYSNDFAEEYQVGQRYNLVKGDVELTIRKFLAIYLFRYERWGRGNYDTAYNALCNHIEDIVAYFLQQIGGNDTIRIGGDYARSDTGLDIYVYYGTGTLNNILITDRIDDVDYSHCYGDGEWTSVGMADVEILSNGSLVYNNMAYSIQESVYIGKEGYGDDYMEWTNIGLDFHLA